MSLGFPEIVCTEHTLGGSPRLEGRRLAVGDVVSILTYGSLAEAVEDYALSQWQVKQALQYCAVQQCIADKPVVFCHNCSHDKRRAAVLDIADLEEIETDSGMIVRGNGMLFLGTMAELIVDWYGEDRWLIASDLLINLWNELLENE